MKLQAIGIMAALLFGTALAGCAGGRDVANDGFLYSDSAKAAARASGYAIPITPVPVDYPRKEFDQHIEGCVIATFDILPNGDADHYRVLYSFPNGVFDQAALAAINQAKFEQPARPGRYAFRINYSLNKGVPAGCEDLKVEPIIYPAGPGEGVKP